MNIHDLLRSNPQAAQSAIQQMIQQVQQQRGLNGGQTADVVSRFLPQFQNIMSGARNFNPASMGPLRDGLLAVGRSPQLVDDGGMYPGGLSQRPNEGGYNGGPYPAGDGLNRLPYVQGPGDGLNRLPYVRPGEQLQSRPNPTGVVRDNAASLRPSIPVGGVPRKPTQPLNRYQSPGYVPTKPASRGRPMASGRGDNGSMTGFNQRLANLLRR